MPTGSKGMINQLSNMVAPQVSGQGKNDSTWQIVTGKNNSKQPKELFKNEDFPPLPKPSTVALDNQNDMDISSNKTKHIHSRAKLQKNIAKITPYIKSIKLRNQRARTNKNCEDDKSTISSLSKESSEEIGNIPTKNSEENIKNTRRCLRIKQKQEKLNKRLIEAEKLNNIIKRIENEYISSFFEDDDSNSSNIDYLSNSTLEIAFAARMSQPLL